MISIPCIIGRHRWVYTEAEYGSATEERLGLVRRPAMRQCNRCGKEQRQSIHCLGHKPEDIECTWKDAK